FLVQTSPCATSTGGRLRVVSSTPSSVPATSLPVVASSVEVAFAELDTLVSVDVGVFVPSGSTVWHPQVVMTISAPITSEKKLFGPLSLLLSRGILHIALRGRSIGNPPFCPD